MRVIAYPDDRQRLLDAGFMAMPVYSRREPDDIGREIYRTMRDAADLMGLMLSEPILEVGDSDGFGGRIVTVRAAVCDTANSHLPNRSTED